MAKRKPRPTKKKLKAPKYIKRTAADRILVLIKYTERSITDANTGVDEFFRQQAVRLRKELEELKTKNAIPESVSKNVS